VAVAHTLLVIGYHILKSGAGYRELGAHDLEQSHKEQLELDKSPPARCAGDVGPHQPYHCVNGAP